MVRQAAEVTLSIYLSSGHHAFGSAGRPFRYQIKDGWCSPRLHAADWNKLVLILLLLLLLLLLFCNCIVVFFYVLLSFFIVVILLYFSFLLCNTIYVNDSNGGMYWFHSDKTIEGVWERKLKVIADGKGRVNSIKWPARLRSWYRWARKWQKQKGPVCSAWWSPFDRHFGDFEEEESTLVSLSHLE